MIIENDSRMEESSLPEISAEEVESRERALRHSVILAKVMKEVESGGGVDLSRPTEFRLHVSGKQTEAEKSQVVTQAEVLETAVSDMEGFLSFLTGDNQQRVGDAITKAKQYLADYKPGKGE